MTLADRLAGGRPTTSFELLPARRPEDADALHRTVSELTAAGPDFVSVTHGAAGAGRAGTLDLLAHLRAASAVPVLAHLTCGDSPRAEVVRLAEEFLDAGVRAVLALRGDPPREPPAAGPPPDPVPRGCDLVELLQVADLRWRVRRGPGPGPEPLAPLTIAVAAFPRDRGGDIAALRAKQDAGAAFAVCQVGWCPREHAAFVAAARAAGITIPLLPGVVPATDLRRLARLEQLTGVPVPRDLLARLEGAARRGPAALHRAGVAASVDLARRLLDVGAPGVHLYPFNRPAAALEVAEALGHVPAATTPEPALAGGPR